MTLPQTPVHRRKLFRTEWNVRVASNGSLAVYCPDLVHRGRLHRVSRNPDVYYCPECRCEWELQ